MENQSSDFKTGYVRLISLLRRRNRTLGIFSKLQGCYYPNFVMLPRRNYFEAAMELVARRSPRQSIEEYRNEILGDRLLRESFRKAVEAILSAGKSTSMSERERLAISRPTMD